MNPNLTVLETLMDEHRDGGHKVPHPGLPRVPCCWAVGTRTSQRGGRVSDPRMVTVTVTVRTCLHEVFRDSDGHLLCVLEVTTDGGRLLGLSVLDPRDYEGDDD